VWSLVKPNVLTVASYVFHSLWFLASAISGFITAVHNVTRWCELQVGYFRKGRNVKGKRGKPLCEEVRFYHALVLMSCECLSYLKVFFNFVHLFLTSICMGILEELF
jgi:hypothetical protein